MRDLPAEWVAPAFLERVSLWVAQELGSRGRRLTGGLTVHRLRFWSAVLRGPTETGTVWLKVVNPGQGFEPALMHRLGALVPGRVVAPLAVDEAQGWLLMPDGGTTLADSGRDSPPAWRQVVVQLAQLQQQVASAGVELLDAGLPRLTAAEAPAYLEALVEELAALPEDDPQRVGPQAATALGERLRRVRDDFDLLAGSGIPDTLQPNDVGPHNVFVPRRGEESFRFFDLGDAFWSHPFAALMMALRIGCGSWPAAPDPAHPLARAITEAYLGAWPEVDAEQGRRLVAAADRLAAVHRCESWRRLLAPLDPQRLAQEPPRLADWVGEAVGLR